VRSRFSYLQYGMTMACRGGLELNMALKAFQGHDILHIKVLNLQEVRNREVMRRNVHW
jgi:hypothetical protein